MHYKINLISNMWTFVTWLSHFKLCWALGIQMEQLFFRNGYRISRHLNYVSKKSSKSSLLDSDIYGLLRCVGPMVCRTNGVSDQWCVGPMVSHRFNLRSPLMWECFIV